MKSKQWYSWPNEETFNVWHNRVVEELNLPRVGFNAATGEPDRTAQATTAYTELRFVGENDYRAVVEDYIAEIYSDGLGELSEAPPSPFMEELIG